MDSPSWEDTSPEARRVWLELLRRAPSWRKWELVAQMTATVRALALAGLRRRFPHASEEELRRRLAGLLYGEELASKAYGPLEPDQHVD